MRKIIPAVVESASVDEVNAIAIIKNRLGKSSIDMESSYYIDDLKIKLKSYMVLI